MSFRCAIRELRIGIDNTVPDKVIALPPWDFARPGRNPLRRRQSRDLLSFRPRPNWSPWSLTFSDGSASETKTFKKASPCHQVSPLNSTARRASRIARHTLSGVAGISM